MSDSENSDASVTWEDFFDATTTELAPSLLGMFDALLERNPHTKCQKRLSGSSFHLQAPTVRPKSPSPLLKQCLVTNTIAATAAQDNHQSLHQYQQTPCGATAKSTTLHVQSNKSLSSLSLNTNCDNSTSSTHPSKKHFVRTHSGNTFISLSPNVKRILSNLDDKTDENGVINEQSDRDSSILNKSELVEQYVDGAKSNFYRSKSVCNHSYLHSQNKKHASDEVGGSTSRLSQVSIKYETKSAVRKSDSDIHIEETTSTPSSAKNSPFWTKIGQKQFTTSSPIKSSRNSLFDFRHKPGSQDKYSDEKRLSSCRKMEIDDNRIPKIEIASRNCEDSSPNTSLDILQTSNENQTKSSNDLLQVPRPLSMSSITSSTSTSSASSGVANKTNGNAYLASIESLDDDSDCENHLSRDGSTRSSGKRRDGEPEVGSQGSGDSGILANGIVVANAPGTARRPRYCDPDLSPVQRVFLEILDTEAVYVSALREVIQGYLILWEEDTDCILSNYIPDLFSNLKEIYAFNNIFLRQLEDAGQDAVNISKAFIDNNAGFKIYTDYCTNYPKTMSVLTELMSKDTTAKIFRDQQARLGHSLPLGSYLLKPVQRILKYHLLLQNLVNECNEQDVLDVKLALSTMTGIARHINDMKRKHEHAVRVQEIQSLLYGWDGEDLTTFGELCVEGSFRMHGAKAQRHAFLFDKMLLLTKNREDGILSYKMHIMCSNLMLIESVQGELLSFHVIPFDNPKMQCTLQARNLEQKREWTLQLKRVILENYNAVIPSHARQLVMELGQNKTEDDISIEKPSSSKKPHSAPEYLQRRRIDRDRRKSETGLKNRLRKSRKSETLPVGELDQEDSSNINIDNISPNTSCERASEGSQSRDGSKSREPFVKFGSWRRKSEPGIEADIFSLSNGQQKTSTLDRVSMNDFTINFQIPHYNSKTLPKKIYKLKKAKNKSRSAKFYTDLDSVDHEEILHISESNDHLDIKDNVNSENLGSVDFNFVSQDDQVVESEPETGIFLNNSNPKEIPETIENIVSQLLMQNHEFQKIFKKQRKLIGLRNRINKTSALNTKPKVDTENNTSDSEVDTSLETYENILNNTDCDKNNLDKQTSLMTKSKNIFSNLACHRVEEMEVPKIQTVSSDGKCLIAENQKSPNNDMHLNNYLEKITKPNYSIDKDSIYINQMNECNDKNIKSDKDIYMYRTEGELSISKCNSPIQNEPDCNIGYESINHIWQAINSPMITPFLLNMDDKSNPNAPEVWLKYQNEHMNTSNSRKSESLPRSFELINEKFREELKYRSRDGKLLYNDRPLTIASENTTDIDVEDLIIKKDFNRISTFSDMEIDILKNNRNIEKLDTNHKHEEPIYDVPSIERKIKNYDKLSNMSSNIHPEYKIYRPCVNLSSFKNVFVKSGYRRSKSNDEETLCDNLIEKDKKQPSTITKNYSRSLLQRFRNIVGEDGLYENSQDIDDMNSIRTQTSCDNVSVKSGDDSSLNVTWKFPNKNAQLPIYKQGSKSLGARIAQSDYANPQDLFQEFGKENILINKYSIRPDSLLSNSSHFTSSSDGCACDDQDRSEKNSRCEQKQCTVMHSDSFYEKTFEAIESIKDSVPFRDSAVYSDHEDVKFFIEHKDASNLSNELELVTNICESKLKIPLEIQIERIQDRIMKNHQVFNHVSKEASISDNSKARNKIRRPIKLPPPIPAKPELNTVILKNVKETTTEVPPKSKTSDTQETVKKITEICDTRPTSIVEKLQSLKVNSSNDCVNSKFEINKAIVQRRKELQVISSGFKKTGSNIKRVVNKDTCNKSVLNTNNDNRNPVFIKKYTENINEQHDINNISDDYDKNRFNIQSNTKINNCKDDSSVDKKYLTNSMYPIQSNLPTSSGWVKHVVGKFQ